MSASNPNLNLIINKISGTSQSRTSSLSSIDKKPSNSCNLPHHRNLAKKLEKSENLNSELKIKIEDLEKQAKLQIIESNKRFDDYCLKIKNEMKLRDLEVSKLKTKNEDLQTSNKSLHAEIEELKKMNLQKGLTQILVTDRSRFKNSRVKLLD